ncbi:DUF4824 family protein [Nitrospina gracilis]|uniref:DUF4824 family protein n=1 Tax=Nitrospina gracilis TaxID=35801 RepID=UPI001F24F945|nr:DUF4824 family protein [Nitrospina gracilis]MCF8720660.1 hypothetical protein [Nitrospina gracilis Nb-211]
MKRYGLALAIGLVLIANVWVIAGVVYNRYGEPDATLTLTERELPKAWQERENTGLFLRLTWQMPGFQKPGHYNPEPGWFTADKLTALGFRVDMPVNDTRAYDYYQHQLPRDAFIVLEMEGPAWKLWRQGAAAYYGSLKADLEKETDAEKIKSLNRQIDSLKRSMVTQSRLFAVDAGPSASQLRQRYPDRSRYLIVRGIVRIRKTYLPSNKNKKVGSNDAVINGYIQKILVDSLHVPHLFRDQFLRLVSKPRYWSNARNRRVGKKNDMEPRYAVTLNYGRRFEPWITEIAELK